jgi:hypothetical protein
MFLAAYTNTNIQIKYVKPDPNMCILPHFHFPFTHNVESSENSSRTLVETFTSYAQ